MPESKILADNILALRLGRNESQLEFAYRCGISIENLSHIECEKANPTLSTLQKIAAYTNVTVCELLTSKD